MMKNKVALVLCSGSFVGQVSYSRRLIHALGLPLRALDGKTKIGDAFAPAEI